MKRIFSIMTVLVLALCLTVPAFAYDFNGWNGQTYGDRNAEMDAYYEEGYVYLTLVANKTSGSSNQDMYLIQSTAPMKQNNVNNYILASSSCSYIKWSTQTDMDGGEVVWSWVETGNGTLAANQSFNESMRYVAWASYDLYDNVGNLVMEGDENFFPVPPLAELVLGVTEEEMVTVAIPEMVGAMKVLVPCGVGLMALLVGLKLFGKRSLLFPR